MDASMDAPEDAPRPQVTQTQARAGGGRASAAVAFASAKMLDAQGVFQRVVKQELQVLLAAGVKREDAVRMLLHRIVESTDAPEPAAVRSVMRQFQMNYDDAVRALIVKQELGRLKRKGMDSFAAIEELTRKMQRVPVLSGVDGDVDASPSPNAEPSEVVDESVDENPPRAEEAVSASGAEEPNEATAVHLAQYVEVDVDAANRSGDAEASAATTPGDGASTPDTSVVAQVDQAEEHAQDEEGAEKDVEKQLNLSSLTLCQRIDKVSISSAGTRASHSDQLDGDDAPGAGGQDAGTQSPRRAAKSSSASALTPPSTSHRHTRKRRAPFGMHGRSNSNGNGSDGSISPERHVTISSSLSSRSHDLHPSVKKQKLCEVGDGFLSVLSRKAKHQTPPESPAASGSDTTSARTSGTSSTVGESLSRGASKNLVKRPRSSHGMALMASDSDDDSPILEHDDVLLIRHLRHRAKRHKSAAGSSAASDNGSGRLHAQPASP